MPGLNGAAQGDHREVVTREARKDNVLALHPVHPRLDQGSAAVPCAVRQNPYAHSGLALSCAAEARHDYDHALLENWEACWSKDMCTNRQMRQSREMARVLGEMRSVV